MNFCLRVVSISLLTVSMIFPIPNKADAGWLDGVEEHLRCTQLCTEAYKRCIHFYGKPRNICEKRERRKCERNCDRVHPFYLTFWPQWWDNLIQDCSEF